MPNSPIVRRYRELLAGTGDGTAAALASMNELLAAAEMPPAACPETPALSAPAVTSAAPAVTLVFGFDGQLIRQEREGDPPKLSKEAIRGILSLWIEYLEVKGIFRLGCQVAPAADSTPIDGKAGPSD